MQSGLTTNLEVRSVFTGLKFESYRRCWLTKQTISSHLQQEEEKAFSKTGYQLFGLTLFLVLTNLIVKCCGIVLVCYLQDSLVDERQFTIVEVNHVNEVLEDASTNSPEPEGNGSNILDIKGPLIEVEIPSKEYDIPELASSSLCQTTTNHSEDSKLDKEIKSHLVHTDNLGYVLEDHCHLTQDYAQGSAPEGNHFPNDISDKNWILEKTPSLNEQRTEQSCQVASGEKSTLNFGSVNNAPIDVIASSPQQPLPNDKDRAPVTFGEATSSEFIESSDREQPGPNVSFETPIVIDRNIIQEVEKEHNMEFFMGRALKTPERYMKIRNYILDMWEKTKPNFLFKTAVRGGLRNCGDVNSIGRVHAFLEDFGAINEGCLERPVPRIREQGEVTNVKENFHMESWVNSLRPRKKRQRNMDRDWVDSSKAEGMTIQVTGNFGFVFYLGFRTSLGTKMH